MKRFSLTLFLLFFTFSILHSPFFISQAFAQTADLGKSQITPASPFYFLKSIREIAEMKLALTPQVKALRLLEFSTRRIREVNSLAGGPHEDLIQSTLETYTSGLNELIKPYFIDEILASRVKDETTLHLQVLESLDQSVSNPSAKRSIRTTIWKLSGWFMQLENKMEKEHSVLVPQTKKIRLAACDFLSKTASSSALNPVEKEVFTSRARQCSGSN